MRTATATGRSRHSRAERVAVRLALVVAMLLALPAPAGAQTVGFPEIGFGEQSSGIFYSQHWRALGLKDARLLIGWDALNYDWQRKEIDGWMKAARRQDARVLIAFSRSRTYARRKVLPSPKLYGQQVRRFMKRYPDVRAFIAWNEANHCSQPTCHKPELAAAYFDELTKACGECDVVAADVLDTSDMHEWIRDFKKAAKHKPKIWGLHNYIDANRFRTAGTRKLLEITSGDVWFTETGGLVRRSKTSPIKFPDSPAHAAKATEWVLRKLARLSPRVKRIYLYHWEDAGPTATWDSALLDRRGRPRPAYDVLARWVQRAEKAKQAAGS